MSDVIKHYKVNKFDTEIDIIEVKPSQDLIITSCIGDKTKRQALTQIKHEWLEKNGYKRVGGVNLGFFDTTSSSPIPLGLHYADSGFLLSKSWTGDKFLELIYQNGDLIIDEINGNDFQGKYPEAKWGASLSYSLVIDGEINTRNGEKFSWFNSSEPRTLIGQKADKTFVLAVTQGRGTGGKGLTGTESAKLMLELGCHVAINGDGGGSSTMDIEGKVVNKLQGGWQRPIASALLIYTKGDYTIEGLQAPTQKYTVTEINKKVKITATTLRVREWAGTQHSTVGTYSLGEIVEVTGVYNVEGVDWYRTGKGFIHSDYVEHIVEELKTGKVTASSLNVRSGNSTSHPIVKTLPINTTVTVFEEKNEWYRIGVNEWVSGEYVDLNMNDKVETPYYAHGKSWKVMTTQELIEYFEKFDWTRVPKELHVHHTWKPSHANFNGSNHQQIQYGMWNYHVNTNGWIDIAQHLSLAPDGKWILGRDFNMNPVSISGRNNLGFAIEMIGNFDVGHDKFEGKQKKAMMEFTAFFLEFFKLTDKSKGIVFHNEYSGKTCAGSSIDKKWFIEEVEKEMMGVPQSPQSTKSWQQEYGEIGIDTLHREGLLSDADGWKAKDLMSESTPLWLTMHLLGKLADKK